MTWPAVCGLLEEFALELPDEDFPKECFPETMRNGENLKFAHVVREALYKEFTWESPRSSRAWPSVGKANWSKFSRVIGETNDTLAAVGGLIATRDGRSKWVANPRIKAVVTFNLDTILQAYVKARWQAPLLRTVERPSAGSHAGRINLYHMHGMLRWDRKWCQLTSAAPDEIVLTEKQYFDFFDRPTSLFNYTFLHTLREHACLFLGLSMKDDNLRRLLHYSFKERVDAYLREGIEVEVAAQKSRRHFAVLRRRDHSQRDHVSRSLRQLGVDVVWIKEFGEIPTILQKLYEYKSRQVWSKVFPTRKR